MHLSFYCIPPPPSPTLPPSPSPSHPPPSPPIPFPVYLVTCACIWGTTVQTVCQMCTDCLPDVHIVSARCVYSVCQTCTDCLPDMYIVSVKWNWCYLSDSSIICNVEIMFQSYILVRFVLIRGIIPTPIWDIHVSSYCWRKTWVCMTLGCSCTIQHIP